MSRHQSDSDWDYQDELHGPQFLETREGEDFANEEEDALIATGCSELVEPEEFWEILKSVPGGLDAVQKAADRVLSSAEWKQAAEDHAREQSERKEP